MTNSLMLRVISATTSSIDRVRNRSYWMHLNGNLVWTGVHATTREVENIDPRTILDNLYNFLQGVPIERTIPEYIRDICDWADSKGWTMKDADDIPEKLMLIVTEISEAMEEYRRPGQMPAHIYYNQDDASKKPEGFPIELADAVIRIFHLAGDLGIDLEDAINIKMEYNHTRPFRHGGKKA